MATPSKTSPDLWDRMLSEGQAAFTLAAATQGASPPQTDRERDLVNMGVAAGVLGALRVMLPDS